MAEVKIKPLGDRVIVKPIERETMKGGIIIPDTAKEKPMEGEVLAVGAGKLNEKRRPRAVWQIFRHRSQTGR